jgi:DNA-binding CsgD family transcriptional regulator
VSRHHTKRIGASPSQIVPSAGPNLAPDVTLADTYVGLCDWHGCVVWRSANSERLGIGDELWKNASGRSKDSLRTAVAGVVTLRESRTLEVENVWQEHFRLWMWPLNEPEVALCILAKRIPSELALITERETACLRCLAQGMSTRQICQELNIGLTTVHTHLRRCREKLGLANSEALIGFAGRYFFAPQSDAVKDLMGTPPHGG